MQNNNPEIYELLEKRIAYLKRKTAEKKLRKYHLLTAEDLQMIFDTGEPRAL